ncbi:hypothetical protein [Aegicerativicinus sediminis]|uniref:hypothetical protein n=1 Tax=Aegicerativicinus sediminis TaxID=2893202 RepID=UPI001E57B80F|nr:hypothetical protein [Aegicerativicinus sediminis]
MKQLLILLFISIFLGCKNENSEATSVTTNEIDQPEVSNESSSELKEVAENPEEESQEDIMAANIRNFLSRDYLKGDMDGLTEKDRKFQYAAVDLNGDGKDEYFIRFMSPYFCGTGGCSMVLIDHEANVITEFTVMEPPIWVENEMVNGWKTILIRSGGELKALTFNNGTYPSNPSVVKKAPYDAASGNAYIMFDDNFNPSKTFTF